MEIDRYKYRTYETRELLELEASLDYHDPELVFEICRPARGCLKSLKISTVKLLKAC